MNQILCNKPESVKKEDKTNSQICKFYNTDLPQPKLFVFHCFVLLSSELDHLLRYFVHLFLCLFLVVFPCLGHCMGWALQINIMDWTKVGRSVAAVSYPRPFSVPPLLLAHLSCLCSPVVFPGILPFRSNKDRPIPALEISTGIWMTFLWLASAFKHFSTEQTVISDLVILGHLESEKPSAEAWISVSCSPSEELGGQVPVVTWMAGAWVGVGPGSSDSAFSTCFSNTNQSGACVVCQACLQGFVAIDPSLWQYDF